MSKKIIRKPLNKKSKSKLSLVLPLGGMGLVGAMVAFVLLALLGGKDIKIETQIHDVSTEASIELSSEQPEALIEDGEGNTIFDDTIVSVDTVNSKQIIDDNKLNFGRGASFNVSIDTPEAFVNDTNNQCWDLDGVYGAQCVDGFALFQYQYTDSWLTTCGTGTARGLGEYDCAIQNAGDNYIIIENPDDIQAGDWVVFSGGLYGHVGMARGSAYNGYVALYGENQGGIACEGGGAGFNTINKSLGDFMLAYRPVIYIHEEPEPEPVEGVYYYVEGDTFGQVLINLGFSDGSNLWGENGDVEFYNEQLYKQGILNYYDNQYWNNIPVGTEIKLEKR